MGTYPATHVHVLLPALDTALAGQVTHWLTGSDSQTAAICDEKAAYDDGVTVGLQKKSFQLFVRYQPSRPQF